MVRRNFIKGIVCSSVLVGVSQPINANTVYSFIQKDNRKGGRKESYIADAVIIGGGLGGFAAAHALLRNHKTVIMTEETDWIGGQLTSQGVPPDEHQWIETEGATQLYRDFRTKIRDYYKQHYPLIPSAGNDPLLNPGGGRVSRLCHEPRVAVSVLESYLAPYISSGRLKLFLNHKPINSETNNGVVQSVEVESKISGERRVLYAPYFIDATELGDLLPLTGTEYVSGTESKAETGELHAPEIGDPENVQSFTMCYAIDYVPGENHTIEKPKNWNFWRAHIPNLTPSWPGRLLELHYSSPRTLVPRELGFHPEGGSIKEGILNLWDYRKIIDRKKYPEGFYKGDATIVNWPINDYMLGNLIDATEKNFNRYLNESKQLSLSLLYWLQTEAPRPDGGKGWTGVRLRRDIMGTEDGMAKYPYVRESRRIKAVFTVLEEHVGKENREMVAKNSEDAKSAANFHDSVGIGYYPIDLHPSTKGMNYIDFPALRFQIPLGALLPIRMRNILPANKNIGTTHITNGCYRLHPVEWGIGEAVGLLTHYALEKNKTPHEIREDKNRLSDFQDFIRSEGIETTWNINH